MLVHARSIIKKAYRAKKVVVAFNTFNAETTLAVVRAAQKVGSPTLLEISEKTIAYLGMDMVIEVTRSACDSVKIPIAIHLDHGHNFEVCKQSIDAGFSSVMIDGSALSYEKNVALTKRVVQYAHSKKVVVQGEVGALKQAKGRRLHVMNDLMTDPAQAADFVRRTGVDTLGVAVGTLHGPMKMFHKLPHIDFKRLGDIKKKVSVPLVLHGASGVPVSHLRRAARLGVTIVNIDTELRFAYVSALRQSLRKQTKEYDPRVLITPALEAVEASATAKLTNLKV